MLTTAIQKLIPWVFRYLLIPVLTMVSVNGYTAWVQKASFGGTAKHRCTGFSIGNKGYIGLGHTNSGTAGHFKDFWEYDPSTNSWSQIADFGGGYRYHATGFSIGNYGYVGLGENDANEYCSDFWKYIPLINTWVQVAPFPGEARRGACAFVIGDSAYVGTGQTEGGYAADFYRYDPSVNLWTPTASFTGEARSSAVAFSYNLFGYVGTGHVMGNDTNDFYRYDPQSDSWLQKASVGGPCRQDATGFVVNGKGWIGTGNDVEGEFNFDDFWYYDFDVDTWTQAADFAGQGRRYMVSFVIDDVAYCGTGTNGTNFRDFWAFYDLLSVGPVPDNHDLRIFPNPATEGINIALPEGMSGTLIKLYNEGGQLVMQQKITSNPIRFFAHELGTGTFYIELYTQQGTYHTGKFILLP